MLLGRCLFYTFFSIFIVSIIFSGCSSPSVIESPASHSQVKSGLSVEVDEWIGTPHRIGGTDRKGIDCSALVRHLYRKVFNVNLPRTTKDQVRTGMFVTKKDLQAGDLVFFRPDFKERHVGVYLGNNRFVHASSSHGVIISSMDSEYWQKCYWQSRRIL